jgi:hypothetical protein
MSDGGPGRAETSVAQLLCVEFDIEYQVNVKNPKNINVVPVRCEGDLVCDDGEECPDCPDGDNNDNSLEEC